MKLNYSKRSFSTYLLSVFVLVLTSSCTIYQNVPNDDGIYSDSDASFSSGEKKTRVIEENSDEHREYEKNYFTKELESLEGIDDSDVLTDIDNYSSVNDSISEVTVNYTPQSWGYGDDDDIVVNINLNNGYRWGGGFWNYCDPYFGYGFYNPWFGQRNYWGWFYNRHRFRPYFYGGYGGYWVTGGAAAYEYYAFRVGNRYRYYRNGHYGRRGAYSSRVAANTNSVYSRSRRASSTNSRVSSVYRRGNQTARGRSSSTTRPTSRTTPTSRTRPTITRGNNRTSSTRRNTSTRSRNSRGSSRTNRSSSSRSRSSARSSSSRSRGSSARSSSRSSSSRSSGSSRSSSSRRKG
ncbi:MAG: hypothetical protein JXR05_05290 [Flavobacteriaceae bacterium]